MFQPEPVPADPDVVAARVNVAFGVCIGLLTAFPMFFNRRLFDDGSAPVVLALFGGAVCLLVSGVLVGRGCDGLGRRAPGLLAGLLGALLVAGALGGLGFGLGVPRRACGWLIGLTAVAAGPPALASAWALLAGGADVWREPAARPGTPSGGRVVAGGVLGGLALLGALVCFAMCAVPWPMRCVVAGTRVDAPGGPVPIESLRVGDRVWSRDAQGRPALGTVTAVATATRWLHRRLTLDDGRELRATAEHPVHADGAWVAVGALDDAAALTLRDGTGRVLRHRLALGPVRLVDLTVEPHANFVADGVLVHNKSRIGTNESSAMGSLRSLATSQEQFKAQALVDQDGDGIGEYGWLGELAGTQALRGSGQQMNASPFIAAILGVRDANGIAQKSGYLFALYLRGADGRWQREPVVAPPTVPPSIPAAANGQEAAWLCYAWPNTRTQSGNRAFVVTQAGDVYQSPNTAPGQQCRGTTRVPAPGAALGPDGRTIAHPGTNFAAGDGGRWTPCGN